MKSLYMLLFVSLIAIQPGYAYESMIRHGYANCISCHFSATGAGLLNNYGKVIAAQVSTFGPKTNFPQKLFHQGIQARLARLATTRQQRTFPMQLDYLAVASGKKWQAEFTLAKAPSSEGQKKSFNDELYVRKALLSFKRRKSILLQLGRDAIDSGLNVLDHTLFIRSQNRRSVEDLSSVLRGFYFHKYFKLSSYAFFPSYQESSRADREYGYGAEFESYTPKLRLSGTLSFLSGESDSIKRQETTLALKKALWKLVFLGQGSFTKRKVLDSGSAFDQESTLFKTSFFPLDSIEAYSLVQKLFSGNPFKSKVTLYGHGLNWKPLPFLTLSYDAKRNIHTTGEFQSIFQLYFNGWFL